MDADKYIPIRVGKTGKEVHAARRETYDVLHVFYPICGVCNTHNRSKHPRVYQFDYGTEITCKRCLAKIAEAK